MHQFGEENKKLKAENTLLQENLSSKTNEPAFSSDNFKEDKNGGNKETRVMYDYLQDVMH